MMNGRLLPNAIELAAWVEDGARRLLRQAALGELGNDLIGTADETLITNGLSEGDAEITISAAEESDFPDPEPLDLRQPVEDPEPAAIPEPAEIRIEHVPPAIDSTDQEVERDMQETRIMEPIPAEDEIKITATPWLDEISDARPGDSLEWPAPPADADRDLQHRERIDTPRVRHLFPVPDSDWDVSHLEYEHFGRR